MAYRPTEYEVVMRKPGHETTRLGFTRKLTRSGLLDWIGRNGGDHLWRTLLTYGHVDDEAPWKYAKYHERHAIKFTNGAMITTGQTKLYLKQHGEL